MKNYMIIPALLTALTACQGGGSTYVPMIDGPKQANFAGDLTACQALAKSNPLLDGNKKNDAMLAAAVMGMGAGLEDDAAGERVGTAIAGAILGGAIGAAGGAYEGNAERSEIVSTCMSGRGHKVVR